MSFYGNSYFTSEYSIELVPDDSQVIFQLYKNGTPVEGSIVNLPADLYVNGGSIVYQDNNGNNGTYIKLSIENGTEIYIDITETVKRLSIKEPEEDEIIELAIDENYQLSTKIKPESIGTEQIANDAITTDKVVDSSITSEKLADGVIPEYKIVKNEDTGEYHLQKDDKNIEGSSPISASRGGSTISVEYDETTKILTLSFDNDETQGG